MSGFYDKKKYFGYDVVWKKVYIKCICLLVWGCVVNVLLEIENEREIY